MKKFFPSADPTPDNCKNTAKEAGDDRALFCGKGTLVEKNDDGTNKVTVTERDLVVKKPGEFTSGYSSSATPTLKALLTTPSSAIPTSS